MKTAISIPDPIFQAAETMATRLSLSRSELFTAAISEFMSSHKYKNVTLTLNKVYEQEQNVLDEEIKLMQSSIFEDEKW